MITASSWNQIRTSTQACCRAVEGSVLVGSTMMQRSSRTISSSAYTSSATGGTGTKSIIRRYEQSKPFRTITTLTSYLFNQSLIMPTTKLQRLPLLVNSYTGPLDARKAPRLLPNQQCRTVAAKAANKPTKKGDASNNESTLSYWEQKKATKDRRRELFMSRQERKERVKVRRAGKPKDAKKIEFQSFYLQKKVTDEFLDRKSRQVNLEWKIRVAVLLERLSVVLPDKEPWEVEYDNLKLHLNRFGKQYPKEFVGAEFDYDQKRPATHDEMLAQLPFTPAPRETEADASGDVRTTNRKLKTKIFLTVQEQENGLWHFPTVDVNDNETLLDASKRAIPEQLGTDIEFWCPSNCPWSVHLSPYTDDEQKQNNLYGTKTFFMKLQYDEGDVILFDTTKQQATTTTTKLHDYAWLDRQEMVDRVKEQQSDHMSKFYYYML